MATKDNPSNKIAELPLTAFELPKWLVEPAVRSCRLFNTALDFVFYDVSTLRAALAEKDAPMQAGYSITSSARASSIGGTSRPSALAVCRLITSSNLVDCRTGRSAGFAPLRMLPA
jgi:hypothetical protein